MHFCHSIQLQNGSTSVQFFPGYSQNFNLSFLHLVAHIQSSFTIGFVVVDQGVATLLCEWEAGLLVCQQLDPVSLDVLLHVVALNKSPEKNICPFTL